MEKVLLDVRNLTHRVLLLAEAGKIADVLNPYETRLDEATLSQADLVLTDGDHQHICWLSAVVARGYRVPKRTIVRLVESIPAAWIYHDGPYFATVTAPQTPAEAAALLQRMLAARTRRIGSQGPADTLPHSHTDPQCYEVDGIPLFLSAHVYEQILSLAQLPVDIVVTGETGTGKSMLAQAIHRASRRPGPFVSVNCGALPEALIEGELFGAEQGAYTGAHRPRPGKFELANDGTIFLDELDSMPLHLQTRLLGVLQDRSAFRLGGSRAIPSSFRVVAAAQFDLDSLVSRGTLRADLRYRLSVAEFTLPPLRATPDWLLPVFSRMVQDAARRLGATAPLIEPNVADALHTHGWPGNMRELRAAAERFVIGLSPVTSLRNVTHEPSYRRRLEVFERTVLGHEWRLSENSLAKFSERTGLPRETARYKLKSLGILSAREAVAPAE